MVESLESITNYEIPISNNDKGDFFEIKLKIPYIGLINGNPSTMEADVKVGYDCVNKVLKIKHNGKNYFFNSENKTDAYIGKKFNAQKKAKKMNLADLSGIYFLNEAFNKYTYKPEVRNRFNIQSEFDMLRLYFNFMKSNLENLMNDEKNKIVLRIAKKTKPAKYKEYSDEKNTVEIYRVFHEFKGDENDTHYFFTAKGKNFKSKKGLMNLTRDNLAKNIKPLYSAEADNLIESLNIKELKAKVKNIYQPKSENSKPIVCEKSIDEKIMGQLTSQGVDKEKLSQTKSLMKELKEGIKLNCSIKDEYYELEMKAKELLTNEQYEKFIINPQTANVQEINTAMRKINAAINNSLKSTLSP